MESAYAHADFDTAFRDGARLEDADRMRMHLRVVRLGDLPVASGRLAVGDAFTGLAALAPPAGRIPDGSYPIDLALVHYDDDGVCQRGDARIAAARIAFSAQPVARWLQGDHGAEVDSGTVAFKDGGSNEWAPDEADADRLLADFGNAALGPSANALMTEAGGHALALFSSGLGDGIYDGYFGLDASGGLAAYVIDFDLLVVPRTIDVEIPWPRGRGAISDDTLREHAVEIAVPWLDPSRLVLECKGSHHAFLRWRAPDGRYSRIPMERKGKTMRLTPGATPPGATLTLRVVVGDQPATVCG